jgi:hypothetical protein
MLSVADESPRAKTDSLARYSSLPERRSLRRQRLPTSMSRWARCAAMRYWFPWDRWHSGWSARCQEPAWLQPIPRQRPLLWRGQRLTVTPTAPWIWPADVAVLGVLRAVVAVGPLPHLVLGRVSLSAYDHSNLGVRRQSPESLLSGVSTAQPPRRAGPTEAATRETGRGSRWRWSCGKRASRALRVNRARLVGGRCLRDP